MDDPVLRAAELARSGQKPEARRIIAAQLRQNRDDYRAWLVMAQLVDDPHQAIDCMRQVVRLRPDDPKMQRILAKLEAEVAEQPPFMLDFTSPPPPPTTTEPSALDPFAEPAPLWGEPSPPAGEPTIPPGETAAPVEGTPAPAEEKQKPSLLQKPLYLGLGALTLLAICVVAALLARRLLTPTAGAPPAEPAPTTAPVGTGGETNESTPTDQPTPVPTPTSPPTPAPAPTPTPDPQIVETTNALDDAYFAPVDLIDWLSHSGLLDPDTPRTLDGTPSYKVGDTKTFYVIEYNFLVECRAKLRYENDLVAMWVETGVPVDDEQLAAAADTFAADIVPTVRDVFGEEWSPGVDNDPRLHILHVFSLGPNIAGQYVYVDEYTQEVFPYSNEKEMFYISLFAADIGSDQYMSTLAHEFQHMIRWHNDVNEDLWLNEGLSQLAERIAGYDTAFTHFNYLYDSRTQLNTWSEDFRTSYSHYGAGYLFALYLWEQFGSDLITRIADQPQEGLVAIGATLADQGVALDDVFADWTVANYLDDPAIADGQYGYETESLISICPRRRVAAIQAQPRSALAQYTANYVEIEGEGEFTVNFQGETEVGLIPTTPKNGQYIFWSNRADSSTMSLTRAFDLSGLESATLQYWTWYDIQDPGDSGFALVSTDDGNTWNFLQATSMQASASFVVPDLPTVPAYTGTSGGGSYPSWLWEQADLSPYVGGEVLIRFEYLTNISYTGHGWALDTIRIPELDYTYDVEEQDDTWLAQGFIRTTNRVPQSWALYLIEYGDQTTVRPIEVTPDGAATATVTLAPESNRATVVVAAMAPTTQVEAHYHLSVDGGQLASLQNPPGVLYQDDFENPCGEFLSFILPDYAFGYKDGRYEIRIDIPEQYVWTYTEEQVYRDLAIEVDATFVEPEDDTTMGVICRYEDPYNFYSFEIRNDGKYRIFGIDDGYLIPLQDWTDTGAVNTGPGATNHIKATCQSDTLTLFVNGDRVGSVSVDFVPEGNIGLSASAMEEGGILVAFDNLVTTRP